MTKLTSRLATALLVLSGVVLSTVVPGCFQEDNDREFRRTTKPGIPSEFPDESVAQRKERLRTKTRIDEKIEKRAKALADKKAKKG